MKHLKHRVLVIDDDPGFLDLITGVFKHLDYKVTTVSNPVDAVNEMKRHLFPVVLLDYGLPTVNGDTLISVLQEIHPKSRIIVMSGMRGEEIEEKFQGRGYFHFFEKASLNIQTLRDIVKEAISY